LYTTVHSAKHDAWRYPFDIQNQAASRRFFKHKPPAQDVFLAKNIPFSGKPTDALAELLGGPPDEFYYHATWSTALPGIQQAGGIVSPEELEKLGIKRRSGERGQISGYGYHDLRDYINVGQGLTGLGTALAYADFYTNFHRFNQRLLTNSELQQEYQRLCELIERRNWDLNPYLVCHIEKEIEEKVDWDLRGSLTWTPLDGHKTRAELWRNLLEIELKRREGINCDFSEDEAPYPIVIAINPALVTRIRKAESVLPGDTRIQGAPIESFQKIFVPHARMKDAKRRLTSDAAFPAHDLLRPWEQLNQDATNNEVITESKIKADIEVRYWVSRADDVNEFLLEHLPEKP